MPTESSVGPAGSEGLIGQPLIGQPVLEALDLIAEGPDRRG